MSDNLYKKLSEERKLLQAQGLVPEWYTTAGYQMFKEKYQYDTDKSVFGQFKRIADTAAKHVPDHIKSQAKEKFFELLWKGWLSPSTPVLANMGTGRGLPVSCSGSIVEDSIDGFYKNLHETACLTKQGFGTASDLSYIRPRGTKISVGGTANGVVPVIKEHVNAMRTVSQGSARRGAWAAYLNIEHGDFWEVINFLLAEQDDVNIGWIVKQSFINKLNQGDEEATTRYKKVLKVKMITGKGYFFFVDKANEKRPLWYKELDLKINNSQLCNEISLFNDKDHTYTCILSSMNLAKYDEWKDTDSIYWATIFLDCVASEFIEKAKGKPGLEKAIRFTEKSRALGLGVCGFHTLLMQRRIPFESLKAHLLNIEIFSKLKKESDRATHDMSMISIPEFCNGYPRRNTHCIAIAPTKSTALLMGGISEGINPDPAMVYTQLTSAGEVERINPVLLDLMKEKDVYNKTTIKDIIKNGGSIQHVSWLTEEEKDVFKTAFEINQEAVLRLAKTRAKYIDQWQSLNLFFSADESEEYISKIHKQAFLDPDILGLYYIYTKSGVSTNKGECEACQ